VGGACLVNAAETGAYRNILKWHRTNPLFDRIVIPFFLMLKHVSLSQVRVRG